MANKPFDQRIINFGERPTSSDLNIAFSQLNAATGVMLTALTSMARFVGTGYSQTGSLGASFLLFPKVDGADMTLSMTSGLGRTDYGGAATNIGDPAITGLGNLMANTVYSGPRIVSSANTFTVPAGPGVGKCRRDVIAIRRPLGEEGYYTPDVAATDIYDPGLNKFDTISKQKTYTYDTSTFPISVINEGDTPSDPVVYIKGAETAYTTPDDLLAITPPYATGPQYLNIGIVNVVGSPTSITAGELVDARRVISPNETLTFTGSATIGATAGAPGAVLSSVSINTPAGIRASIYKSGANGLDTNSYLLAIFGPRSINRAAIDFSVGIPDPSVLDDPSTVIYPAQIRTGSISLNQQVTAAAKTAFAGSESSPAQTVAIGQPVHYFSFTLGRMENILSSTVLPVTATTTGSLEIATPPGYPAMYPAGTYDVSNNKATRTYYLNYAAAPSSPTTGLPTPTYSLGTTNTNTASTATAAVPASSAGYDRLFGFVVSPFENNFTIPAGVWKFSIKMRALSGNVRLRTRLYLYNGSSDPEAGTIIAETVECVVPYSTDPAQYLDFYSRIASATAVSLSRVYISIEAVCVDDAPSVVEMLFGNDNPALLETNILAATPTVTIPDSTTDYPAGTYPITASTTGTVTASLAQQAQKWNPAAESFQSGPSLVRTVPITFTVTLDTSSTSSTG